MQRHRHRHRRKRDRRRGLGDGERHAASATPAQVQKAIRLNATWDAIEWVAGTTTARLYSLFTRWHPAGDYNDDQRTDLTVWRPSTGQWFVHGISTTAWGQNGDVPLGS